MFNCFNCSIKTKTAVTCFAKSKNQPLQSRYWREPWPLCPCHQHRWHPSVDSLLLSETASLHWTWFELKLIIIVLPPTYYPHIVIYLLLILDRPTGKSSMSSIELISWSWQSFCWHWLFIASHCCLCNSLTKSSFLGKIDWVHTVILQNNLSTSSFVCFNPEKIVVSNFLKWPDRCNFHNFVIIIQHSLRQIFLSVLLSWGNISSLWRHCNEYGPAPRFCDPHFQNW